MYVPGKSPFEAPAPLRAYLEREFAGIARAIKEPRYELGNVLNHGALGDDDDDTAAILAAVAASRDLFFPGPGIYGLSEEIYYDSTAPVHIRFGAGAQIRTIGATNRAIHIDGQPANTTSSKLVIENANILGSNSGTADAAIFLDGVALGWITNPVIVGTTFDRGIYGYGFQQGEIRGGYIAQMATPIHLEGAPEPPAAFGYAGANAIEIHGVSLSGTDAQVLLQNLDSGFVHDCHMIGALVGIDCFHESFGVGAYRAICNHIEAPTGGTPFTAALRVRGAAIARGVELLANKLTGNGVHVHIVTGSAITLAFNKLTGGSGMGSSGDVTYESGTSYIRTLCNHHSGSGTFTDASTFPTSFGNQASGALDWGRAVFSESLDLTDPRVLVLATGSLPGAAAAQDGRIVIEDAGAGDRNLVLYAGGQRFRIDGGAPF